MILGDSGVPNLILRNWGGAAYDVVNFGVSVGGLFAPRTLNVGLADGLGRPQSMFGVSVSEYNNVRLLPLTKMPLPGVNQPLMLFGVGSRGGCLQ